MYASKYFDLGKVLVTNRIYDTMTKNKRFTLDVGVSLQRYCVRDWGNLSEEDKKTNNAALLDPDDLYLLAAYQTCESKIYIITNRVSEVTGENVTTVCFPDER